MKLFLLLAALSPIALLAQMPPTGSTSIAAIPQSLVFAQLTNAPAPAAQTVMLTLPAGTITSAFTATASTSWLTVTPASGTVPGNLLVSVNPAGLAAATYSGLVSVNVPSLGTMPQTIPVTYVIAATPSLVTDSPTVSLGMGGAAMMGGVPGTGTPPGGPGTGGMNPTLSAAIQLASTAGASPFTAILTNTCANAYSLASATGTTPATLTVNGDFATLAAGTNCTATVTINSTGLASAIIMVTAGMLNGAPPMGGVTAAPTVDKVVNAASYVEGAVAPGEIVTLFGSNLGPTMLTSGTVTNGTLGTTLANLQVTFGGIAAPILYARTDQMSVLVPFEASTGLVNMQILANGQTQLTMPIPVVSAVPGVFTTASTGIGQGAILNQDGTVNSTTLAATRGSVISIFLTGAGAVTPAAQSGALASTTQLQTVNDRASVAIGGQPASVSFAGAVPGSLLGLYQINATVPASTNPGNASLVISIGAAPSQTGVTVAVK